MRSNLLLFSVKAGLLAGVSDDAIFNYRRKWPRTCVSEPLPPSAVLLGKTAS